MPESDLEELRELRELARLRLQAQQSIILREQEQPSRLNAALTFARQGLTFGAGDELESGFQAAKEFVTTPGSLGERREAAGLAFGERFDDLAANRIASRRLFPGTAFGAEALGGTATGLGIGRAVSPLVSRLSPPARSAGIGAFEGSLFGTGVSEPDERLSGAIGGGIVGGFGTPLFQGLGVATMSALRPAARRLGEALAGTPRDRAVREVIAALDADDITLDDAARMLQELGPRSVLADLGDAAGRLGRATTSQLGPAASRTKRFLDQRQGENQTALRQTARRAAAGEGFDRSVVDIINTAETQAKPIYDEVFSEVIDFTPMMQGLLQRPALRSAQRRAARILENEGFSTDIINDVTDVRYMDAVKRALDDQIGAARRSARNNEARVLTQLKNDFVGEIDRQVPRYADARNVFAGEQAIREAVEFGQTAFRGKVDPADFRQTVGQMTDSERQGARIGFLRWLTTEVANESVNRSSLARRFAERPAFQSMVNDLFPDQQAVMQFLRESAAQARFGQTRNLVTGGSPTSPRQQDIAALQPGLLRTVIDSTATPGGLIEGALRLVRGNTKLTPEVLTEIQQILFDPNLIPQRALRTNPVVNAFNIPRVPPPLTAGAFGGLLGSQMDQTLAGLERIRLIGRPIASEVE